MRFGPTRYAGAPLFQSSCSEVLQKAVIEEFGRRFLADVFVPAMRKPKGLARLNAIVERWIVRMRDVEVDTGCIYTAGAFELDDREGELRELLLGEVTRWRAALRRTVLQAVETGELKADTDPAQLVGEICNVGATRRASRRVPTCSTRPHRPGRPPSSRSSPSAPARWLPGAATCRRPR